MAKINDQDIDTLRERADIVDVISGYTQLKKSGGTTFKGLCPFHSEKTPSFSVDQAKGLYHCFGCGEGGNVYTFIQKVESLEFPETVEWLARRVGFDLRYEEMRPGEQRVAGVKLRLIEANRIAARFFHERLVIAPEAHDARRYLEGRGFSEDVAERWQLGFSADRDTLCRHLLRARFTEAEVVQAGLGRKSDRDGSLYDSFRGRIMFPTWNLQGDVVGFGARALGDAQPKYLNSAESPAFQKSRLMYGLDRAKSAITRGAAIVVEGYTDVIALHEAGVTEAVATNGVALGESHFELLKKFTQRAVLMFDADEAGKGATERGFDLQHKLGMEVLVAPLPLGRDPADVASSDGAEGIRKIIDRAQPLMEFKLEQTVAKLQLDTPEAKGRAVRDVVEVLGWHPDPVARHEYAFLAARLIDVDAGAVQSALSERRSSRPQFTGTADRDSRLPGNVKVEREALRLLLTVPGAASAAQGVSDVHFTSAARREVFRLARGEVKFDGAVESLSPDARSLLSELSVAAPERGSEPDGGRSREVFTRLRVFGLEREIRARRATLQDVNPLVDPERHDALFTELVALEAERRDLLRGLQGTAS